MNERARVRKIWPFVGVAGLVLWILVPVVIVCLIASSAMSATIDSPQAVVVHPEPNGDSVARPVQLGLVWDAPGVVVAPAWDGVTQEVLVTPGDAVVDGTPIARIDGMVRVAAKTVWPFSRKLTVGDSGEDVRQLSEFLRARGIEAPDISEFTNATLDSVRQWASAVGVNDTRTVDSFDPSWVIFLSHDAEVLSANLTIGSPAPEPGTPILELAPQLLDAVLMESGKSQPVDAPSGEQNAVQQLAPTIKAFEEESLIVSGTSIMLDSTQQRVSSDAITTLAELVSPAEAQVAALLRQENAGSFWRLPAPAVVTGSGKEACVFIGALGQETSLSVTIVASTGGTLVVDAPLNGSEDVLLFPTSKSVTCQ